jgi:ammonia channel protein AmtB
VLVKIIDKIMHFTVTESEQKAGLDLFHYGTPAVSQPEAL